MGCCKMADHPVFLLLLFVRVWYIEKGVLTFFFFALPFLENCLNTQVN